MHWIRVPPGRNFRLVLGAQAVTSVGDGIATVALAFAALQIGGAAALGWVMLGRQAAILVAVVPAGAIADRLPRRRLIALSLTARAVGQAGCATLIVLDAASVRSFLVFQMIYGVGSAFQWPAFAGFLPALVPREVLMSANAWLSLARNGVSIVGPAIGGVLVAFVGTTWGLAADAGTFLVAATLIVATRLPPAVRAARFNMIDDIREGWRSFSGLTWIWTTTAMFAVLNLVAIPTWLVLGPAISDRRYGGAGAWGAILATAGAGAIAGSILALRFGSRAQLGVVFVLAALQTVQLVALGLQLGIVAISAAAFVAAAAFSISTALWTTLFQSRAPEEALSRLSSYTLIAYSLPTAAGFAVVAPIAARAGDRATLLGAAAVAIAVIAVAATLATRADAEPVEPHDRPGGSVPDAPPSR
jgi:MFS family permease